MRAFYNFFFARRVSMVDEELAQACSYVNTSLNGIWLNHNVDMPSHFYLDHPLGTVIWKAKIGDFFACCQGCTIGAEDHHGEFVFPVLGEHVEMMANSSIIGKCQIGNNVLLAANSLVKNTDIPDNSIVFGMDREIVVKTYTEDVMKDKMLYF